MRVTSSVWQKNFFRGPGASRAQKDPEGTSAPVAPTILAEKNHTLRVQFLKKKIDMCQKHDEVTRFDGTFIKTVRIYLPV